MFTLHIKLGAHHGDARLLIFSRCVCDVYSAEVSENDEPQPWLREAVSLSLMLHLMYVQRLQCAAIVNGGTHVRRQNAVSFVCSSVVVSEGKGAKQQFVLGG
jgi:hypothetical protein